MQITYTSDYFQDLYDLAVELIKKGLAYVDHQVRNFALIYPACFVWSLLDIFCLGLLSLQPPKEWCTCSFEIKGNI